MPKERRPYGDNWSENLAEAIVRQAVDDYRDARKKLKYYGWDEDTVIEANKTIIDCESFFLSQWFTALTQIDPEWLLEKLRKEPVS